MLALKIIGILVLIIFLICQIRIGADISFMDNKLVISAKFCGLLLQVYPRRNAHPKKPKSEEPAEHADRQKKEKKAVRKKRKKDKEGPGLMIGTDEITALLKKVLKGLGKFTAGFHVDRFLLHWVAAGNDPCDTARVFGSVNAILSSLAPYCDERFHCRNISVWTAVDFTSDKMKLDFGTAVVLRIGAIFSMLFTIAFGAVGILVRNKFYWMKLKRTDPEEYEFQIENPGFVTRLIRSAMEKKRVSEKEPDKQADTGEDASLPVIGPYDDKNNQTEKEREPINGE